MKPAVNLSALSSTLPGLPGRLVSRDNIISLLEDSFSPDNKVIVVYGPSGIGKTTVLAQFVLKHADACVSFFVGEDRWASGSRRFLFDLCQQMLAFTGREPLSAKVSGDRLRQVFETTLAAFTSEARRSPRPIYLVLDGLDETSADAAGGSVRDLVPVSLFRARNVYVLASTSGDASLVFQRAVVASQRIPALSLEETASLLSGLGLTSRQIGQFHEASGAIPGYLAETRRQLTAGANADDLLERPPRTLAQLIGRDWQSLVKGEDSLALAMVAYAPGGVSLELLSTVVEEDPSALVSRYPFLKSDPTGVEYLTRAHRQYAAEALKEHRGAALERMVSFYERDPESDDAVEFLPSLLVEADDYDRLRSLATPQFVASLVRARRDPAAATRLLTVTARQAHEKSDVPTLVFAAAAAGIIRTFVEESGTGQSEIAAIAALQDYELAIQVAGRFLTNREQLAALATIARAMAEAGLQISPDIEDAIDEIAESITGPMPPEDAARIAASFFSVRPDTAIRLVERCAGNGDGRALDRALAMLSVGAPSPSTRTTPSVRSRAGFEIRHCATSPPAFRAWRT